MPHWFRLQGKINRPRSYNVYYGYFTEHASDGGGPPGAAVAACVRNAIDKLTDAIDPVKENTVCEKVGRLT